MIRHISESKKILLSTLLLFFVINSFGQVSWNVQEDGSYVTEELMRVENFAFTFKAQTDISIGLLNELDYQAGRQFNNGFIINGTELLIFEAGEVIGEYGEVEVDEELSIEILGSLVNYMRGEEVIYEGHVEQIEGGFRGQLYNNGDGGGVLNNIEGYLTDEARQPAITDYNPCDASTFHIYENNPDHPALVNAIPPYYKNEYEEEKNWVETTLYNGQGGQDCNIISETRQYYDDMGRPTQSQAKDIMGGKVWATQTIYDAYGRPAISTLPAPTGKNKLEYDVDFIKNADGNDYNWADDFDKQFAFQNDNDNNDPGEIDNPRLLDMSTPGTLGHYYSWQNTTEGEMATTSYPYSRVEYSEITGAARRSASPGDEHRMGKGHESYSFTMKLGNLHELFTVLGYGVNPVDWVLQYDENNDGKSDILDDKTNIPTTLREIQRSHKFVKTIAVDADGKQAVVFADYDGQEIARALVGDDLTNTQEIVANVEAGNFHDFHVPLGCENTVSLNAGFDCIKGSGTTNSFAIYNLKTDEFLGYYNTGNPNLSPGFYRVVVDENSNCLEIKYTLNYYNFTVNVYNTKKQLVATVPPNGVNPITINFHGTYNSTYAPAHTQLSLFRYNSAGQLLWSQTIDAGRTRYAYSIDGKLRYTQNAKQATGGRFSYTNYDRVGRVIEVGEYIPPYYNTIPPSPPIAYYFPNDPMRDIIGLNQAVYANTNTNFAAADPLNEIASVSYTEYDEGQTIAGSKQQFTIGKVAKTWNNVAITYYSYNAEGELVWEAIQIQETKLTASHQRIEDIKFTHYTYDLLGNVTRVEYQKNAGTDSDKFTHFYNYDFEGRLTSVQTEDANGNQREQATYSYYQDGSVKEMDMADGLQNLKYRYTIHGWLKSINGNHINNSSSAADNVFSMSLEYYKGDYIPANDATNNKTYMGNGTSPSGVGTWEESFTGNITAWRWKNDHSGNTNFDGHYGYEYQYNERNELKSATFGVGSIINTASPYIKLNTGFYANNDYQVSGITYDNNGNISTLNRKGANGVILDNLNYNYYSGTNKLSHINDIFSSSGTGDIVNQANNNYTYSEIGELIEDNSENNKIIYDVYGKVVEVTTITNVTKAKYYYDANGQRVRKDVYNAGTLSKTTYYIMGNIYERAGGIEGEIQHKEITISGGGRIGVAYKNGSTLEYNYELTDHLGNVRAVIKRAAPGSATPLVVLSYADYYPFGWQMPGRNQQGDYRYAYQGQEKDPETGWEAFELRMYDGRVGRWMTTDPYSQYHSPYLAMGNNPINGTDPDGGRFYFASGAAHDSDGTGYIEMMLKVFGEAGIIKPTDIHAHSRFNQLDVMFTIGVYSQVPYYDMYSTTNRDPIARGADWRIKRAASLIRIDLENDPLGEGEQLNLTGYSTGSVIMAQASLMLAREGKVIDNLVLIGTTIKEDSKLYQTLLDEANIKNVIRVDIEGDNVQSGVYALPSFIRLGDAHPHFKYAFGDDAEKNTQELAEQLKKQGVE